MKHVKKSNNLKMERWNNFKNILNNNKIIGEKKLSEKQLKMTIFSHL